MRRFTALLLLLAAAPTFAAAAVRVVSPPRWNSGYNSWWPRGFGYPPLTVHASYPCEVTVYGPTFNHSGAVWNQLYGGGVGCSGGVGRKTLTIYDQTQTPKGRWATVAGSTVTSGPRAGNPVLLKRARAAYLGHAYRSVAVARLFVPNGYAGCSFTNSCSEHITITAVSRALAP